MLRSRSRIVCFAFVGKHPSSAQIRQGLRRRSAYWTSFTSATSSNTYGTCIAVGVRTSSTVTPRKRYTTVQFVSDSRWSLIFVGVGFAILYQTLRNSGARAKEAFDQQEDQLSAKNFCRVQVRERPNWKARCEDDGFLFHSTRGILWGSSFFGLQDPYWCESGLYLLSEEAKASLEIATWELHNMCLEVVDRVVNDDSLMTLFEIPPSLHKAVQQSWERHQPDLLGRFDIMYDGSGPPKMLEYNADTPTLLVESALAQRSWMNDREDLDVSIAPSTYVSHSMSNYKQFNRINEALVGAWPAFIDRTRKATGVWDVGTLVFASQWTSVEERCTMDYLASTAKRAGFLVQSVELENLIIEDGFVHLKNDNLDTLNEKVHILWKLYPYEWLAREALGEALEEAHFREGMAWCEPPWKLVLSNKSLLPMLWEMFPGHPNLLPAFFSVEDAIQYEKIHRTGDKEWSWVSKPKFGREGVGIEYSFNSSSLHQFADRARKTLSELESPGKPFPPLGQPIFQLFQNTPTFNGRRPVLGSWVINGDPSGICVREDLVQTTNADSCFCPHLIVDEFATADVYVSQILASKGDEQNVADVTGRYVQTGQLRGSPVYHCSTVELYLLRNSEGDWMFTTEEGGGFDGMQGVAVTPYSKSLARPTDVPDTSWKLHHVADYFFYLDYSFVSATITITALASEVIAPERAVTPTQATLRKALYGSAGGRIKPIVEQTPERHAHGGGGGGVYRGIRPYQQQPNANQQQQNATAGQTQGGGRKSSHMGGSKMRTGTCGRMMGNVGSGART